MQKSSPLVSLDTPLTRPHAWARDDRTTEHAQLAITNPMGLDLRCAALLARAALQFAAEIKVTYSRRAADGKNLMDLVALDVPRDEIVTVCISGHDAYAALQTIRTLFYTAFEVAVETHTPDPSPATAAENSNFEARPAGRNNAFRLTTERYHEDARR
jgi:phosphotransferase system HPr (HPr) family protein